MIEKIVEAVETLGVPIRYRLFKSKPEKIPFAVYYEDESDNFAADNVVYDRRIAYVLELYANKKDREVEAGIEKAFEEAEIYWEKEESYIESEKLLMTAYYFTI